MSEKISPEGSFSILGWFNKHRKPISGVAGGIVAGTTIIGGLTSTVEAAAEEFSKPVEGVSEMVSVNPQAKYDQAIASLTGTQQATESIVNTEVEPNSGRSVTVKIDSNIIEDNGVLKKIDTAPRIINGRTMVPVRFIFEALGMEVNYKDGIITAEKPGNNIVMQIGSEIMKSNNKEIKMDVVPMINEDGRTVVPLRFVGEALREKINWDQATNTASIGDKFNTLPDNETLEAAYLAQKYMAGSEWVKYDTFRNKVFTHESGAVVVAEDKEAAKNILKNARIGNGDVVFVNSEAYFIFNENSNDCDENKVRVYKDGKVDDVSLPNHDKSRGFYYHSRLAWHKGDLVVTDGYRISKVYDESNKNWIDLEMPEVLGTPFQRVMLSMKTAANIFTTDKSGNKINLFGIDFNDVSKFQKTKSNEGLKTIHVLFGRSGEPYAFVVVNDEYGLPMEIAKKIEAGGQLLDRVDPGSAERPNGFTRFISDVYGLNMITFRTVDSDPFKESGNLGTFSYSESEDGSIVGVKYLNKNTAPYNNSYLHKPSTIVNAALTMVIESRGLYGLQHMDDSGHYITMPDRLDKDLVYDKDKYGLREGIRLYLAGKLTEDEHYFWNSMAKSILSSFLTPDEITSLETEYGLPSKK